MSSFQNIFYFLKELINFNYCLNLGNLKFDDKMRGRVWVASYSLTKLDHIFSLHKCLHLEETQTHNFNILPTVSRKYHFNILPFITYMQLFSCIIIYLNFSDFFFCREFFWKFKLQKTADWLQIFHDPVVAIATNRIK